MFGDPAAEFVAAMQDLRLGWFTPFLGAHTLNRSQGLYQDLARERPGSLLFWLNRQEHPPARYVAVVRHDETILGMGGDV